MLRENGYVTFVLRPMLGVGDDLAVFTMHEVEARKLSERLRAVADGADGDSSLVEGAYQGGPPRLDQLL